MNVHEISIESLDMFYDFFQHNVKSEFPEYTPNIQEYIFTKGWSKQLYENWLKNRQRYIVGAWHDDTLIGIVDAQMPYLGVSFCNWVMVTKEFQRKGVGRQLLEHFEQIMKSKGAHMTYLYTSEQTVSFYTRVGYQYCGVMKQSWFGHDHYILTKLIAEPNPENFLK